MVMNDEYRRLAEEACRNGSDVIFDNYSFAHAEVLSTLMFRAAKSTARIVTGRFDFDEGSDASRDFAEMVRRLSQEPEKNLVHVIIRDCPEWIRDLRAASCGVLQLREPVPTDNYFKAHKFIIDSRMLRIEEPHDAGQRDVHARVSFNRPIAARLLETEFEAKWRTLSPTP
jgi:hypothetical protein